MGEADGFVDLTVRLSAAASSAVSVHYATANSTATASSGCNFDYAGAAGTLNFAPGEITEVVSTSQILAAAPPRAASGRSRLT